MQTKNSDSRRPHKEVTAVNSVTLMKGPSASEAKINIAKEESMAKENVTTDNPVWNYAGQAQDAWKEIYGYQVKTTQTLMDQMMKWGQTYTDHLYTQVNEATRLSQEYLKSGTHFADELRKNYYHMTEKMTK
ncbi:MAG: hypothetical protein JNL11_16135 [Bdellovibrionaceae bacterium]|nr:hypothetical protein [Pseudobdellovibrionaceae bacterium]